MGMCNLRMYNVVSYVPINSHRAAVEAQERVDHLESNIEDIQKRTGGFFYPNEIQAETLGILPRGPNFRYIHNNGEVSICIYLRVY